MPTAELIATPNWQDVLFSRRGTQRKTGYSVPTIGKAAYMDLGSVAPQIDATRMTATAIITTPTPDRSQDVVHPEGIQLDNYRKNPVVFYDHGFSGIMLPIGKSEDPEGNLTLVVKPEGIEATTYFAQSLCEACQVFALIEEGIVKSTSIGFMPLDATPRTHSPNGERLGLDITLWELLEYSWVGIPDNPEAVRKVLDRNRLAGSAICQPLVKSLSLFAAPVVKTGRGMEKPSMAKTITKSDPPDDKKPDDEVVDDTKDNVPADDTAPNDDTPGEDSGEKPLGAQTLEACFSALKTLSDQIEGAIGPNEHPEVKQCLGELKDMVSGCLGHAQSAYSSAYGKDMDMPDDSDADTSVEKFLAGNQAGRMQIAGLAHSLKMLGSEKNLTPAQKLKLKSVSGSLAKIQETAKAAAPKPVDPQLAEIAEVKNTIKALAKKFGEILPASKS